MTNELGTTLDDIQAKAERKREALKTLYRFMYLGDFCIYKYAPNDSWKTGFERDYETIRKYIEEN